MSPAVCCQALRTNEFETVDVLKLPFSQISASFGQGLLIFPDEDYFQEMRGFLPDLWVPAAKAEELAIKLVLNSK